MVNASSSTGSSTPLASLHRFEFILQHKSDQLLRNQLGVGFSQMRIMTELSASKPITQRHLAAKLYQTEANISRQLKTMVKNKLVSITRKTEDKRQRQVVLTSKGSKLYDQSVELITTFQKKLLGHVDYRDSYNLTEAVDKLLNAAATEQP